MRIKNNVFDWIINALCLAMCAGAGILLAGKWSTMPSKIATHFDLMGNPNGYSGKGGVVVVFVVMIAMCVGMTLAESFPNLWNLPVTINEHNAYAVYRASKYLLEIVKLLLVLTFAVIVIVQIYGKSLPVWFTPVELVLILGTTIVGTIVIVRKGKR